ncbi:MAG TPA: choice-of-anchor tandem repeat GloVer-containing protein [Candidatus Binatia bacterium]|nr:choice-of-anchor tandem repeat GloVer-containing protein [Candidatus Binatia bacterium]
MTKPRTFVPAQRPGAGCLRKPAAFGVILLLFCAAAVTGLSAQSIAFSTLANFNWTNGAYPIYTALVRGADGNFYGTTAEGGAYGYGLVFRMTPGGTLTTLYNFCAQPNCADGAMPMAGLLQGSDGNFYGTTMYGGGVFPPMVGTVFRITPAGALTTLYNFCSQSGCTDGRFPEAALTLASDGNFYGTTSGSGGIYSAGTVFKVTAAGALTTLHDFCSEGDCTDGYQPVAPLVQGSDGNFYGTTFGGGTSNACSPNGISGCGTVFRITSSGTMLTIHNFDMIDGAAPDAGLVQAGNGDFYGTTSAGGANNQGTVFRMTSAGTLTTLYSFCSQPGCADGSGPTAPLAQGSDGNLYGTTATGGAGSYCSSSGCGTVFRITLAGTLTTLHSFNGTDGVGPTAGLLQATNGFFYGTTSAGGAGGYGTVFSLLAIPVHQCVTCRP